MKNLIVGLISNTVEKIATMKEKYYGVQYSVEPLNLKDIISNSNFNSNFNPNLGISIPLTFPVSGTIFQLI